MHGAEDINWIFTKIKEPNQKDNLETYKQSSIKERANQLIQSIEDPSKNLEGYFRKMQINLRNLG